MQYGAVLHRLGKLAMFAVVVVGMAGCGTPEERSARRYADNAQDGEIKDATHLFCVDVDLFHRTAGTRWRQTEERVFPVRDESFIKVEAILQNIRPRRTYSVHLVWIRPDGREMFRRYAEVVRLEIGLPDGVMPNDEGDLPTELMRSWRKTYGDEAAEELAAYLIADPHGTVPINEVVYKKAIDLAFAQRHLAVGTGPSVVLDSRLNISRERARVPGLYHVRIYLDRRLLREVPFIVEG